MLNSLFVLGHVGDRHTRIGVNADDLKSLVAKLSLHLIEFIGIQVGDGAAQSHCEQDDRTLVIEVGQRNFIALAVGKNKVDDLLTDGKVAIIFRMDAAAANAEGNCHNRKQTVSEFHCKAFKNLSGPTKVVSSKPTGI